MDILIITTYYPPDTAIAARRPYHLAENLTKLGNRVTVLRSGIINRIPDPSYKRNEDIRIISYFGEDSPAELFERGQLDAPAYKGNKSRIAFLPLGIRLRISKLYHGMMRPAEFRSLLKTYEEREENLRKAVDKLAAEGSSFDIVFSTYGDMENLGGGEYAAEVFGCKWIQDFRDCVAQKDNQQWWEYRYRLRRQRHAVERADMCTAVSKGVGRQVSGKSVVLYNGYAPSKGDPETKEIPDPDCLTICYAGAVYGMRAEAFGELFRALRDLSEQGKIRKDKVRIIYAGGDSDSVIKLAESYGVADSIEDHGYVGREEISRIERKSDLFLVLSWNTKSEQGILTGKFYEGIDAGKPILSILAGNEPNSELKELCDEFNYGHCYEKCSGDEGFSGFCDYLADAYAEKMETGGVHHDFTGEFTEKFRYDNLAAELNDICHKLIGD